MPELLSSWSQTLRLQESDLETGCDCSGAGSHFLLSQLCLPSTGLPTKLAFLVIDWPSIMLLEISVMNVEPRVYCQF